MASDDNFYKREEDRKWRESVETRLVTLTSAQKQTDDDLDETAGHLTEHDHLLEGNPEDKNDNGLKGDVKELAAGLNELRSIMAPDHLGQGGFHNRLRAVENAVGLGEKDSENRWKFATVVASTTIGALATIVAALLAIEPARVAIGRYLAAHFSTPSSSRNPKTISKRSGSKPGKPRRTPPAPRPTEATDEQPAEEVSE